MKKPDRDDYGRFASRPGSAPRARSAADGARASRGLIAELKASWKRHGAQAIEDLRLKRPHDYVRLVASLTKPAEAERAEIEAMSDEEIADEIKAIHKRLAAAGVDPLA